MVCETHLTTYINLLLEAIISVSRGLFCREPYGYQIHSQMSRVQHFPHNIIPPPLIEIDSSPDEYLFYKEAIVKLKLQPLGRILFQVYRKP